MTVPKFMDGWCSEETTQEQFDWLMEKVVELRNLEQIISPLLSRAWDVMSELQEVVDENQDWTDDINLNQLDTSYLWCYWHGTLDILNEVQRVFGIWNPEEDK